MTGTTFTIPCQPTIAGGGAESENCTPLQQPPQSSVHLFTAIVLLLCTSRYSWSGAGCATLCLGVAGGWCIKGNLNAKAPRDVLGNNVQWFHSQGIYYGEL